VRRGDLLPPLLGAPERMRDLSLAEWELVIRQSRQAQLIARLADDAAAGGFLDALPPAPRAHLEAARRVCRRQHREVRWEVDLIRRALAGIATPIVLLKGAAYLLAGLPAGRGRLFADIDILVDRARLAEVEVALHRGGWIAGDVDPYDQRYYRRWMHELPPLRHIRRNTMIDVHHTITPPTSRFAVDARILLADARPVADADPALRILAPADLVLHSATHLFQDGEFDHGLRDLVDLDALLRHFGADAAFWPELTARATALGLGRPLYYAAQELRRLFAAPIPAASLAELERFRPGALGGAAMAAILPRALRPDHPSCDDALTGLARWLLYVRAHHLRMPAHLLVPHLARKALMRRFGGE
jgi:hypothetical protein